MIRAALITAALLAAPQVHAELSQEELKEILAPRIEGLGFLTKNGLLLKEIRLQNKKGMSLDEIKKIDKDWRSGTSPYIKEVTENNVGNFFKNIIVQQSESYSEVFLTDKQGANVAAYPATSDYWQGDEEKFTQAFADGKGNTYIGNIEYDESTQSNAVQISMPMYYDKQVIGVLVIGVKVSVIEAEKLKAKK